MKTYSSVKEFKNRPEVVLTTGSFDGVHIAHKSLIKNLVKNSKKYNAESLVITFHPHPRLVLGNRNFKILTPLDEKIHILKQFNIDYLLVLQFNEFLYNLSPREFIELLEKYLKIQAILIGYSHNFGKNKEGDVKVLNNLSLEFGFTVCELSQETIHGKKISSSLIRKNLLEANISAANELLGYFYSFEGTVIYGDRLGRQIGFPTANLAIKDKNKLMLPDSCYVVRVYVSKQMYDGMMYIGNRPTVNGLTHNIEVNIFDFNADIYGQDIRVFVIDYLRGDYKFDSLDALIKQLYIDKERSIKILTSHAN